VNEPGENTSLAKTVRSRGQYLLAFGVVASLLIVVNIPVFIVFFFGVFAYFMAKMFSAGSKMRTRSIFEFYLSAHEILRNDVRQWYGFEINETINRGERIVKEMRNAPPLVHYALGALYRKVGDHSAAVRHLSFVAENPESFESSVVYPSVELRNYVGVLRKIEREPAEAPLTSAAVRALERARKLKTDQLLSDSRSIVERSMPEPHELKPQAAENTNPQARTAGQNGQDDSSNGDESDIRPEPQSVTALKEKPTSRNNGKDEPPRKPIVEVLHEIYDRNVQ
jgi:hypothetical protein